MISTIDDFAKRFNEIVTLGWIPTHRFGPTGIGKTLEDLLGINENNTAGPDFGNYELKSYRINSNSMLTLFTCSPEPRGANSVLLSKYGYASEDVYENYNKVLHSTLSANSYTPIKNTGKSLKIICDDKKILIRSETEVENAYWPADKLKTFFENKYKNSLVHVQAEAKGTGKDEKFKFTTAYELSDFDYDSFTQLLENGKIFVDLRIGQYHTGPNAGKPHDHGTGFRMKEPDLPLLFKNSRQIT